MTVAMRQQPVPDDQITGFALHDFDVKAGHVWKARIAVGWLRLYPLVERSVEAGNTLKATLVETGISQIELRPAPQDG